MNLLFQKQGNPRLVFSSFKIPINNYVVTKWLDCTCQIFIISEQILDQGIFIFMRRHRMRALDYVILINLTMYILLSNRIRNPL